METDHRYDTAHDIHARAQAEMRVQFADVLQELPALLRNGENIEAIKLVRRVTNLGLREAKNIVDNFRELMGLGDVSQGTYLVVIKPFDGVDADPEIVAFEEYLQAKIFAEATIAADDDRHITISRVVARTELALKEL